MGQKFTREDVAAAQTLLAMSRSQEKIDFSKILIPPQNDIVQEAPVPQPRPANNAGDEEEVPPPLVNLGDIVGRVSRSLEKKLTTSDVKEDQGRLIIPKKFVKKHLLQILNANENLKRGIDAVTYDEGGTDAVQAVGFEIVCSDEGLEIVLCTAQVKSDSRLYYHVDVSPSLHSQDLLSHC